jgi:Z1 domain
MVDNDPIIVEPVPEEGNGRWIPAVGPETLGFLEHSVPAVARDTVCDSAVEILGKGVPPTTEAGQETGLVVGYVQSGKTMSFETVAALARDNGFQMVVVVTGSSNPLFNQSTGRLRRDLRLDDQHRDRRWIHFRNPDDDDATTVPIRDVLDEWRDQSTPDEHKRTILVTVLKNHMRLGNLSRLLGQLDLRGVPVLIIDDEADQASLNNQVAQGQESTTYRQLMALRQAMPNHTYLQYTATPQAPLLINIIDSLSPNFVHVLEAGDEYVGGREFFDGNQPYVRVIPPQQVPTNINPLTEPPETLLGALRVFMVGVAVGLRESGNRGNRSMLVHPSHRTAQHEEFVNWVRDIFDRWKHTLGLPDDDPDKQELLEDFRGAHAELAQTVGASLPSFNELESQFRRAFANTRVLEVNAREGDTPQVDWRSMYGWIVVGGQAMDRGFTIEGLTVTYMPRGVGVGNADTVQQRARFFGYKRRYLGYCRVYLEQGTLAAFESYVTHEEDIRSQLEEFHVSGRPLNEWKRAFVLDTGLRPCRNSVLGFDYMQGRFSNDWVAPRVVQASPDVLEANRRVAANFIQNLAWAEDEGHPDRTDAQRHLVCDGLSLQQVAADLLVQMRITGTTDSQRNTGLLLQLKKAIDENPDEACRVYRMSGGRTRQRGVDDNGEVTNLYQGENPVLPRNQRGRIYPGDRAIRDVGNVSVQIHTLELTHNDVPVADNVTVLTVWVPSRLAEGWLAQESQVGP